MNTHVPAPPSAAVSTVKIPFTSCNKAADVLIQWFGPNELRHVVGGERWWQVRGMDFLDAEWVTQKNLLGPEYVSPNPDKLSTEEQNILRMEDMPVMLYIHGGKIILLSLPSIGLTPSRWLFLGLYQYTSLSNPTLRQEKQSESFRCQLSQSSSISMALPITRCSRCLFLFD
jgi:hypothetical protein